MFRPTRRIYRGMIAFVVRLTVVELSAGLWIDRAFSVLVGLLLGAQERWKSLPRGAPSGRFGCAG
jgi:hypothetical protein